MSFHGLMLRRRDTLGIIYQNSKSCCSSECLPGVRGWMMNFLRIFWLIFSSHSTIRGIILSSFYKWHPRSLSKFGLTPEFMSFHLMLRCSPKMTFPGIDSCYQVIILRSRSTGRSWFLLLLVALSAHGCEPMLCLRCWSSMSEAWKLVTCTGQPLLVSALPLCFHFTGLQMWTGLTDEETEWRWYLWPAWETQEKLGCLAVYWCIKTIPPKIQHLLQNPVGE